MEERAFARESGLPLLFRQIVRCAAALTALWALPAAAVPTGGVQIRHVYPHDTAAFTEGLFYLHGDLFESVLTTKQRLTDALKALS